MFYFSTFVVQDYAESRMTAYYNLKKTLPGSEFPDGVNRCPDVPCFRNGDVFDLEASSCSQAPHTNGERKKSSSNFYLHDGDTNYWASKKGQLEYLLIRPSVFNIPDLPNHFLSFSHVEVKEILRCTLLDDCMPLPVCSMPSLVSSLPAVILWSSLFAGTTILQSCVCVSLIPPNPLGLFQIFSRWCVNISYMYMYATCVRADWSHV